MAIGNWVRWTMGVGAGLALGASASGMLRGQESKPKQPGQAQVIEITPEALKKALEGASGKDEVLIKLRDAQPVPEGDDAELLRRVEASLPKIESIRPLPAWQVPDGPPPHEGAMIDAPYTVQPPDILVIEMLEALPGRPMSGERLVRPDGTVSLGFYGSIHVAGLTCDQVKTKLILHMRQFVTDEALGLIVEDLSAPPAAPMRPQGPPEAPAAPAPPEAPARPEPKGDFPPRPDDRNPFGPKPAPGPEATKPARQARLQGRANAVVRLARGTGAKAPAPLRAPTPTVRSGAFAVIPQAKPADAPVVAPPAAPEGEQPPGDPLAEAPTGRRYRPNPPAESDRVFVDVASYNNAVYYVEGDFAATGRYPITGRETVLDAIQFGAGLSVTSDESTIRLVRPGRSGKPPKVYPIDLAAIRDRGEAAANLQIFPGDRLVVDKTAIVASTLKTNVALARSATVLNHLVTFANAMHALGRIDDPYNAIAPMAIHAKIGGLNFDINVGPGGPPADLAKRQAALKAWSEMISDDPKVREEMLRLIR